jgi:prephenate dehydrogenase
LERGIIDAREDAFDAGTESDADLVYLAAPIFGIVDFLQSRAASLKPGSLVTDAGSTKVEVCRVAGEALSSAVEFVGGHPMAGSHRTGVEHARADLFNDAPYAIVCGDGKDRSSPAVVRLRDLVVAMGARPILLTPGGHDLAVARVSHSPQLVSTAIAAAIARTESDALAGELAGAGLLDMIRLAESDWSVWEDICRTNASNVASALAEVEREVAALREALESVRFEAVAAAFQRANDVAARIRGSRNRARQT